MAGGPVAFVLGGGGVLGAVEVGMLRALFRARIRPDLVLGTSIGAVNGALVAADPTEAVTDRLVRLWASPEASEVYGDSVARQLRRFAARTHLHSPRPLRRLLEGELGADDHVRRPDGAVPLLRGEHRAGRRALVRTAGRWCRRCSPPPRCRGCCRPPRSTAQHYIDGGIVNSIPIGEAVAAGAKQIFVLQVGRIERRADARPAGPGRSPRSRSRSPAGTGSPGRWPRCPTGSRCTCCRPAGWTRATTAPGRTGTWRRWGGGSAGRTPPPAATWPPTLDALMPLPPRWVRRLLLAPGVVLLAVAVVTTLPVWALLGAGRVAAGAGPAAPAAAALDRRRLPGLGRRGAARPLRALARPPASAGSKRSPAFQRAHYVVAGRFLRVLFWQARWTLRLSIDVVGTDPDTALPGRPELVLCRHAGPGDSFILIHALVNWFHREPRIVLKDTPPVGPGHRRAAQPAAQPVHRARPGRPGLGGAADRAPGHRPRRRRRLRDLPGGRQLHPAPPAAGDRPAARARPGADGACAPSGCSTCSPPQPGGLLAALDAAPDAGVIFVAHTGLDRMLTVADVWRELPMDKRIVMRFWSRAARRRSPPASRSASTGSSTGGPGSTGGSRPTGTARPTPERLSPTASGPAARPPRRVRWWSRSAW